MLRVCLETLLAPEVQLVSHVRWKGLRGRDRTQPEMCGPFLLRFHLVTSNGQSTLFLPLSSSLSVLQSSLLLGSCWNSPPWRVRNLNPPPDVRLWQLGVSLG